jgi:hypothetical protein
MLDGAYSSELANTLHSFKVNEATLVMAQLDQPSCSTPSCWCRGPAAWSISRRRKT